MRDITPEQREQNIKQIWHALERLQTVSSLLYLKWGGFEQMLTMVSEGYAYKLKQCQNEMNAAVRTNNPKNAIPKINRMIAGMNAVNQTLVNKGYRTADTVHD